MKPRPSIFAACWKQHELAGGILQVINVYLGDHGLMLRQGTVVDATIIHAPSSTKNKRGKRDPEIHPTKKGNQHFFGMKAHIGVDAKSSLVLSLVGTAANMPDVTRVDQFLHGEETYVCGDAGYTGTDKRPEHQDRKMTWSIAARPTRYKKHAKKSLIKSMRRKIGYAKVQNSARESLTSVSRVQAPVWLYKSALSWPVEKQVAAGTAATYRPLHRSVHLAQRETIAADFAGCTSQEPDANIGIRLS